MWAEVWFISNTFWCFNFTISPVQAPNSSVGCSFGSVCLWLIDLLFKNMSTIHKSSAFPYKIKLEVFVESCSHGEKIITTKWLAVVFLRDGSFPNIPKKGRVRSVLLLPPVQCRLEDEIEWFHIVLRIEFLWNISFG